MKSAGRFAGLVAAIGMLAAAAVVTPGQAAPPKQGMMGKMHSMMGGMMGHHGMMGSRMGAKKKHHPGARFFGGKWIYPTNDAQNRWRDEATGQFVKTPSFAKMKPSGHMSHGMMGMHGAMGHMGAMGGKMGHMKH